MPFVFSQVATQALNEVDRLVLDLRNAPIRGRRTLFRLGQQNMLAYTFSDFLPGYAASAVYNTMPYHELVSRPLANADEEGRLFFGPDYVIESNAKAKVAGDIFEVVSAAIMWNIAARWNRYMVDGTWPPRSGYPRPTAERSEARQVAVLNLPRDYDWVRLLTPTATNKINNLRNELAEAHLRLPTSTPDLAVVVLPTNHRNDALWKTNIMQLLLEGHLNAPRVEFEVYTLEHLGTDAVTTYEAASLYSVLEPERDKHRAVRELYVPDNAQELARRLLKFLNERTSWIE
jgi:hypothetical protein